MQLLQTLSFKASTIALDLTAPRSRSHPPSSFLLGMICMRTNAREPRGEKGERGVNSAGFHYGLATCALAASFPLPSPFSTRRIRRICSSAKKRGRGTRGSPLLFFCLRGGSHLFPPFFLFLDAQPFLPSAFLAGWQGSFFACRRLECFGWCDAQLHVKEMGGSCSKKATRQVASLAKVGFAAV